MTSPLLSSTQHLFLQNILPFVDSSTASSSPSSSSSSTGISNSSGDSNSTSLTTTSTSTPEGLVPYASICFITTIVFTGWLLWGFARPKLPPIAGLLTFLAWLCSFCVCFLVPIDLIPGAGTTLDTVWNVLFWNSFMLMWIIIPFATGYYDNGGFTVKQKLRASARSNLILASVAGVIAVVGVIYLRVAANMSWSELSSLAMAASNTWGLCCLILMAGYGLAEFPRFLWHESQLDRRRDEVCYSATSISEETDNTKDEIQHTSTFLRNFQSKVENTGSEELIGYFREIQNEILETETKLEEENRRVGMYDKDALSVLETLKKADPVTAKHLMTLNAHVKGLVRHLSLVEAQWRDTCEEYRDLDAAIGNEQTPAGRPPPGSGCCGSIMWFIRVRFIRRIYRVSAVFAAILSILLLWMEMTLPFHANLSPLGAIIRSNAIRESPIALQLFSVVPITYLSACAYFPLFRLRLSKLYYIGPRRTDENTLLFNATFMLRVATPLAYNFVLLLKMDATALINFIGQIDVIPFFGSSFTTVFPFFIVFFSIFTLANGWSFVGRLLNIQRFQYLGKEAKKDDGAFDEMRDAIEEGQRLITREIQRMQRLQHERVPLARNSGNKSGSPSPPPEEVQTLHLDLNEIEMHQQHQLQQQQQQYGQPYRQPYGNNQGYMQPQPQSANNYFNRTAAPSYNDGVDDLYGIPPAASNSYSNNNNFGNNNASDDLYGFNQAPARSNNSFYPPPQPPQQQYIPQQPKPKRGFQF